MTPRGRGLLNGDQWVGGREIVMELHGTMSGSVRDAEDGCEDGEGGKKCCTGDGDVVKLEYG